MSAPAEGGSPSSAGSSACAACAGSHRKHTCGVVRSKQQTKAPPTVPLMQLPVKKRLCAEANDERSKPCAACAGGHRKHTCGKVILQTPQRNPDYCAACHGGHRKHTCRQFVDRREASDASNEDTVQHKRQRAERDLGDGERSCRACLGWHRAHTCSKVPRPK